MRCVRFLIVACLALPLPAWAQSPGSYTTRKGDSILSIARHIKPPAATLNQMAYALIKANGGAFSQRTVERLLPDTKLTVPDEATVLATDAETADREIARLGKGEEQYKAAVVMEKQGDMQGALAAYLSAAQLGHGLADVRLGQLYERDLTKTVPRDLQSSIRHYEEARKQGIPLKGPLDRVPNLAGPRAY